MHQAQQFTTFEKVARIARSASPALAYKLQLIQRVRFVNQQSTWLEEILEAREDGAF
jgi:hypothetical protein